MNLFEEAFTVRGMDFVHAGEASIRIKNILKEVGVDGDLMRRVAIAAYEAEINTVVYGGGGAITLILDDQGVLITVVDQGPGIPDVELAMREGYSTASEEIRAMGFGAGMGLPNINRNADELRIDTEVGKGTRLSIRFFHSWEQGRS